jgi:hypothetical protein
MSFELHNPATVLLCHVPLKQLQTCGKSTPELAGDAGERELAERDDLNDR